MLMIELPSQQKKAVRLNIASIPSLNNTTEKEQIRQWPSLIVMSIPLKRVAMAISNCSVYPPDTSGSQTSWNQVFDSFA
jgi:hypothetical protein